MVNKITNNEGIALLMVLVLLILVGGLTASLMAAGVFNIRFSGGEVEKTQAFYAADAGVEFVKANFNSIEDITDFTENNEWILINNNIEFNINVENNNKNSNKIDLISEGRYKNSTSKIKFEFVASPPENNMPSFDYALFAHGDKTGSVIDLTGSSKIIGNVGTNTNDYNNISFGWSAEIDGNIDINVNVEPEDDNWEPNLVYNSGDEVWYEGDKYIAQWWTRGDEPDTSNAWRRPIRNVTGDINYLSEEVNYPEPEFPDFPELSGKGEFTTPWKESLYYEINEDGDYNRIEVSSNRTLTIDMDEGDRVIRVNDLDISQGNIELVNMAEDSKLTFYVEDSINFGGSSVFGDMEHKDNVMVNYAGEGSVDFAGDTKFYGSLNIKNADLNLGGSNAVNGNIFSSGNNIEISGAGEEIGVLYAPNAHLTVNGSGNLSGSAITNSARLEGNTRIIYSPPDIETIPPDIFPADDDNNSTGNSSIESWRKVSPSN